jgi:lipopolysaccharide/colanic/teichoic acid biosynthesis glycosyltransferase
VDVAVALPLALLTAPVVGGLAVISAVRYRGTPWFRQPRVGWHGRPLTVVKIRSLPTSAPAMADTDEIAGFDVDRWGRFLRRTHADDLPQLWSVVAGRMALVGPRPMIASIVEQMTDAVRVERHSMRPGLTGLWQVSVDRTDLVVRHPEWDRTYVRHASLRLDWWIVRRTVAVCLGRASVTPASLPFGLALE